MHASHSRAILRLIVLTSILATLLGSAVDTIPARAATFVVTSTADSGPGTLRQAVLDAAPGDSITFSVTGTINLLSQIGIDKNLTISGPGAASLTISGGNAVRIFNILFVNVNISGLTIANGNAGADNGGGIFNFGGSLTLNNVIFTNNQAPGGSGGAIYQNQGSLTVMNSAFNGSSSATDGAGIMATDLPLMVSNCTFANNTATTGFGGGFRWASGTNSANTLRVLNSTFSNNHAARGSGINRVSSSIDMIANSTFSSNDTTGLGGGLFTAEGTLTLANDTFSANSASSGGGIYSNASSLSLINNTLSANSASTGGGIYSNADSLSLINNILANSTAGDDCFESNSILNAIHNNLIGSGNCQLNTSLDPRLSTLGNNGGPTQTFALLPDSPAIDNGDNATCAAAPVNNLDQRGQPREDWSCDIGAFEMKLNDSHVVTKPISGAGVYTFGPTKVKVEVVDPGALTSLTITEVTGDHPGRTGSSGGNGVGWNEYFTLAPNIGANGTFNATLTLPTLLTPGANDTVCRFISGHTWDCAANSFSTTPFGIISRQGVTAFSDWAIGYTVNPTVVHLVSFQAISQRSLGLWSALCAALIFCVATILFLRRH